MISRIIIIIIMAFLLCINYTTLNNNFTNNINQISAQTPEGQDKGQREPFKVIIPNGAANPRSRYN